MRFHHLTPTHYCLSKIQANKLPPQKCQFRLHVEYKGRNGSFEDSYLFHFCTWENEVAELNLKIQSLNARIDAEKAKRDEAKANLSSAVKAKIDKEANEGIKFFSASAAVEEEIQGLEESNKVLDKEISSFQSLYEDLKRQF
ncbi:hypothetical protein QL285_034593 [Trifolium repens]|nr:hypothetical protein QL285_034593 [Trifolium repens]